MAKAPTDNLAGLTQVECCKVCGVDKCVISGIAVCAHPAKGGLQGAMMHNADTVKRFNAAVTKLKRAKA
jgi:hypothetical protein